MIIAIADDENAVLEAYETTIKKMGHVPVVNGSIRRMMDYLKNPEHVVDILFLDHHFKGEESGVSMIAEITTLRPDLDIIVTTKQPLEPKFVQDIVSAGVGFFKKSVIDPVWLEMEISQRVNIRQAKLATVQRRLSDFVEHICDSREGMWRFPFFGGDKKKRNVKVESIVRLDQRFVYPRFESFLTAHTGVDTEITKEQSWEKTTEIKAGTTQEFGLKFLIQ